MYRLKSRDIYASEIAEYLNLELIGSDFLVNAPGTQDDILSNTFVFFEESGLYEKSGIEKPSVLILLSNPLSDFTKAREHSFLVSSNPKLDFIRTINEFFIQSDSAIISGSSKISEEAFLGRNISIGENVVIGPEVSIGENTQIFNNVVIRGRVTIGKNCIIKDNTTIGSVGYNFIPDEKGLPLQCPNIGKIIIKDFVCIGSNTCIESASFGNTVIGDFVKIDDLVQIGYSSIIKPRSLVTAGVIISRNVIIGEDCEIEPNSTIGENLEVGNNTIIGLGSVVLNDVPENSIFVGNPARLLRSNTKISNSNKLNN